MTINLFITVKQLEETIESLLEEVLMEINSISMGAALLRDNNITDENFDQVAAQDDAIKEKQREFMWNGDDPDNSPPKIKYVAV
jgi:hypothetical protein